jgi:hypothetical protein
VKVPGAQRMLGGAHRSSGRVEVHAPWEKGEVGRGMSHVLGRWEGKAQQGREKRGEMAH